MRRWQTPRDLSPRGRAWVWEASFRWRRMMSENVEWLRERVRQFRERAEQATDEKLRARLFVFYMPPYVTNARRIGADDESAASAQAACAMA
jgi:hypothetical protein